ncbi:MAG: hypothetical protein ACK51N_01615, partial [bacterium]
MSSTRAAGQGVVKVCMHCGRDCSGVPRVKDAQGRYACRACMEAQAGGQAGAASAAGGSGEENPLGDLAALAAAERRAVGAVSAMTGVCGTCHAPMDDSAAVCINCGADRRTGKARKVKVSKAPSLNAGEAAAAADEARIKTNPLAWAGGALAGAGLGVAGWVGLTHAGVWVPLLVVLAGLGAGIGAHLVARDRSTAFSGGVAALMAAIAMIVGWSLNVSAVTERAITQVIADVHEDMDHQWVMMMHADAVYEEWENAGKKMTWPQGSSIDTAFVEADYPAGVWKEATKRWTDRGPGGQTAWLTAEKDRVAQEIRSQKGDLEEVAQRVMVVREARDGESPRRSAR